MHSDSRFIMRVIGGLGNQLFIYAFARALHIKYNCKIIFDLKSGFVNDNYNRSPKLNKYIKDLQIASSKTIVLFYLTKLFPRFCKIIFNSEIVVEPDFRTIFNFNIESLKKRKSLFIQGYFQSPVYFDEYKDQIKADINLEFNKTELVLNLAEKILSSNSVSIHVRRIQYSNLLDLDHYLRAIEIIKRDTENPVFFIFSDDMEWCKNNFPNADSITFIKHDVDNEVADLWLMTQCKHHIIANSSFSWWGAWLSSYNGKIVVAPVQTQIGVNNNFYPKNWITI